MKTVPMSGCCAIRLPNPLRPKYGEINRNQRIVVLLEGAGKLPVLFRLFRIPRLQQLSNGGVFLTCPGSDDPRFCPWAKVAAFRRLFARLFREAIGDTKVLVLIHKTDRFHVSAQLHFANQLIALGHKQVQVGATSEEIEGLPEVMAFRTTHGEQSLVGAKQLKSEVLVAK